jgi:hypothetical protein
LSQQQQQQSIAIPLPVYPTTPSRSNISQSIPTPNVSFPNNNNQLSEGKNINNLNNNNNNNNNNIPTANQLVSASNTVVNSTNILPVHQNVLANSMALPTTTFNAETSFPSDSTLQLNKFKDGYLGWCMFSLSLKEIPAGVILFNPGHCPYDSMAYYDFLRYLQHVLTHAEMVMQNLKIMLQTLIYASQFGQGPTCVDLIRIYPSIIATTQLMLQSVHRFVLNFVNQHGQMAQFIVNNIPANINTLNPYILYNQFQLLASDLNDLWTDINRIMPYIHQVYLPYLILNGQAVDLTVIWGSLIEKWQLAVPTINNA